MAKFIKTKSKLSKRKQDLEADEDQEYEVEKILEMKLKKKKPHYLVKWRGFPESEATWEPEENLSNSSTLLEQFKSSQGHSDSLSSKQDSGPKKLSLISDKSKKIRKQKLTGRLKKDKTPKRTSVKGSKDDTSPVISIIGTLATDVADKIAEHAVSDKKLAVMKKVERKTRINSLMFRVEWKPRPDGTNPISSYLSFSTLKSKCPKILLEYLGKLLVNK